MKKQIKSMKDFQKRYFPKDVGKKCPYCLRDIGKKESVWKWLEEK